VGKKIPKKTKIVLDTNVLISAFLWRKDAKEIFNLAKENPSDDKFLSCALSSGAPFIISGNKHLLKLKEFQKVSIISPRKFLKSFK